MTFNQLLTDLRFNEVPNATQREMLLALAEAIKGLQDGYDRLEKDHKEHCHFSHGPGVTSEPVTTYPPSHQ